MRSSKCIILNFLFIGLCIVGLEAKNVPGFIINSEGKRIEGAIKIGAFCSSDIFRINSFEQVSLHAAVRFRETGKSFKEYFPGGINGFGFQFKGRWVVYISTLAPFHYFNKIKSKRAFLRIVESGPIKLFDLRRQCHLGDEKVVIPEYYLADECDNLFRLSGRDVVDIKDFLIEKLKVNEDFFKQIDYDIKIRNLKWLVMDYNRWLVSYNPTSRNI